MMLDKLKTYSSQITISLALLTLAVSTCTNSRVSTNTKEVVGLQKKVDSLQKELQERPSRVEFKRDLEQNMYKFLIFEEDIDKKKVSLSEIQMKIEK